MQKGHTKDFIFGTWPVIEALRSNRQIDKIMIQAGARSPQISEIIGLAKGSQIPFQMVPIDKLNRLCRKNHQGVIAYIAAVSYQRLDMLIPMVFEAGEEPFILILDRITDVRNIGAIARTAEAAGVHAIVVPTKGNARLGADAVKASAGALSRVNICREENLKDSIQFLKNSGLRIAALTEKTDSILWEQKLSGPLALLLGSEDEGISEAYLKLADAKLKIPMLGEIGSLNVSVAAGIACFEIVKSRS